MVDCVWNVNAHAQKPDFVFRRNGRVHLNRRGRQFSRLLAIEVCALAVVSGSNGSNAGYTVFRGSVKSTGYPLHSPVSSSPPFPCVTVCHHISTGLYFSVHFSTVFEGIFKFRMIHPLVIPPGVVLRWINTERRWVDNCQGKTEVWLEWFHKVSGLRYSYSQRA